MQNETSSTCWASAIAGKFTVAFEPNNFTTGVLVHPCRLAVTGKTSGPSLYHLLQVLGKERVMARIEKALAGFA
jgi:glutamyl-tRNA synthetase